MKCLSCIQLKWKICRLLPYIINLQREPLQLEIFHKYKEIILILQALQLHQLNPNTKLAQELFNNHQKDLVSLQRAQIPFLNQFNKNKEYKIIHLGIILQLLLELPLNQNLLAQSQKVLKELITFHNRRLWVFQMKISLQTF